MGVVGHNCGICVGRSLHDTYNFIESLQHRGRDATGIAAIADDRIDVLKWIGDVKSFDKGDLQHIFDKDYHTFMAHVRYATRGEKDPDSLLREAHPIVIGGEEERRNDHLIIRDCDYACVHNGQVDEKYIQLPNDVELNTETDTEKLLHFYKKNGIGGVLGSIPGAFTLAIADKRSKDIIAARDITGIKPGFLGFKDKKYVLASEDIAFQKNGAVVVEEMVPGTAYYLSPDGNYSSERFENSQDKKCFFEWNYIADVDSSLEGINVRALRKRLGEKLAKEINLPEIDFVSFLPRCPEPAARSFASETNLKFLPIFYKRKAQRSFQGPDKSERKKSIKGNLHLRPGIEKLIRGKNLAIIDDSTVRGNNSSWVRHLLYDIAGVSKAYLLNYTPQIGIIPEDGIPRGCEFGVDMPPEESDNHKFIARNKSLEEISSQIGMPVRYISKNGMIEVFESFGIKNSDLCTHCVGGEHPFESLENKVELTISKNQNI